MKQPTPLWGLVALVLLGLTWTTPGWAEQRTALVIGNAAYGELGVLRNPVNDATDIASALRRLSFDVTLLRDADLRTMQEAVETFVRQLRQGGVGLFYFAGHGMQVQGENYLIPLQARINREQDVSYEAVPVGRILGGMEDAGNQLNIIILDACRDNPFARQWRSAQRGLAMVQAARGSLIAYATAPGTVANDGSGRNGLYTEHLLKHLATPGLSVEYLFKQVRVGVVETTQGKQIPWESSSLVGDFFFAPPAPAPVPSASTPVSPASPVPLSFTPAGPDLEAAMWALVEKSSRPQDVKAFLDAYPNGRFASAARLRFQQLQDLAVQQRAEEEKRLAAIAEQDKQRRAQEAAEAQQREAEQQRQAEAKRREDLAVQQRAEEEKRLAAIAEQDKQRRAQEAAEAQQREAEQQRQAEAKRREDLAVQQRAEEETPASPPVQIASIQPESRLGERASVVVPTTTISGRGWTRRVSIFRMDSQPVSNREFLDFIKSHPQWKKSQMSESLQDGDYLKHWQGDEAVQPEDMDRPVRYVSYFAAEAYCTASGGRVPPLNHYRAAANATVEVSISYAAPYKAPDFNFMREEWANTSWSTPQDPDKRIAYQHGTIHSNQHSTNYTPADDKRYTGRSRGFRCAEY